MFEQAGKLLDSHAPGDPSLLRLLEQAHFQEPPAAATRFAQLCPNDATRQALAPCMPSLLYALTSAASPDASLLNFERYLHSVPEPLALCRFLGENPRAAEILIKLFVGSQFLTEILLRNPEYLERLVRHRRLAEFKTRTEITEAAHRSVQGLTELPAPGLPAQWDQLRRFQQWELLRIGACDTFGLMDFRTITQQLSMLADSLIQVCLSLISAATQQPVDDFAVLSLGKLGGEELNYSSDIDLVFIFGSGDAGQETDAGTARYWPLAQKLIQALGSATAEGFLYRVDMRLRPWGSSGPLVSDAEGYLQYLANDAAVWEKQALLKARLSAGAVRVGHEFLRRAQPLIVSDPPDFVRQNVLKMKEQIEQRLKQSGRDWGHVKAGAGSIRDVEFLTQYLQLTHAARSPEVRSANTLEGLVRLTGANCLHADEYRQLTSGYVFLRTIEHALQLRHNKPLHSLPTDPGELTYLARRLDYPDAGEFVAHFNRHTAAIRRVFNKYVHLRASAVASPPDAGPRGDTLSKDPHQPERTYRNAFTDSQLKQHREMLDRLGDGTRVVVEGTKLPDGDSRQQVTIAGLDRRGELSMICGLLLVHGFDIQSGDVFTNVDDLIDSTITPQQRTRTDDRPCRFIDVLCVHHPHGSLESGIWQTYERELEELIGIAEREGLPAAQGRLARRVAGRLSDSIAATRTLLPVEIEIDHEQDPAATVLNIGGDDTFGFLYELANALTLAGTSITRVVIRSAQSRVLDTLHVTDEQGRKITDPDRLHRLRAAIVLIKHFTHLLPQSPDPESALLHFRDFIRDLFDRPNWIDDFQALQQSDVLSGLARLLGVSDFLWDDFLRLQHENLFPVVTNLAALQARKTQDQLRDELQQEMAGCESVDQLRDALNAFKDREMLRVDMRHILALQGEFGTFSRELTDVAEVTVQGACHTCDRELRAVHGEPMASDNHRPARLCIVALGKCGGRELGFGSDIELMFLYDGDRRDSDGMTAGPKRIANRVYYHKLIESFRRTIVARRQGIFEVDLRLRPYGKAGSLAVTLDGFETYYGLDGPAWPYERQALVKLRPIAGDAELAEQVVELRDRIVYSGQPFDVAAMRAMREKQVRQLIPAGAINAKLSPGALVDCEYLVQGLQITCGHQFPAVRQTNTREALKALEAIGVLSPEQRVRLRDALRFFRRLIDALRMVRGDARDLAVPAAESDEFQYLARRLGDDADPQQLSADLERHLADVQELSSLLDEPPSLTMMESNVRDDP